MGSSKRNHSSVSSKSRDRKKTAKAISTDAPQEKIAEPPKDLLETAAVVDCKILDSSTVIVPALENEDSSSATKVEACDFDFEKLMDFYHNYAVDCLVSSKL